MFLALIVLLIQSHSPALAFSIGGGVRSSGTGNSILPKIISHKTHVSIYTRSAAYSSRFTGATNAAAPSLSFAPMTSTSSSTSTALNMATTKSGGRPIFTEEQFRIEVLGQEIEGGQDDTEVTDDDEPQQSAKNQKYKPCTKPILVFYSAPWCGPCRLSNPVVKEIIKQFVPKIDVVEVCTDDLPEVAEEMGVVSIPTIKIYHGGELMDTIVGCVAKNVLGNAVDKILDDLGLNDKEEEEEEDE